MPHMHMAAVIGRAAVLLCLLCMLAVVHYQSWKLPVILQRGWKGKCRIYGPQGAGPWA